jgi:hypothetical protein
VPIADISTSAGTLYTAPAQAAPIFVIRPRVFRDRAIVANFIFMGDTVRSGSGTCGKAAIMKRKVYTNVA